MDINCANLPLDAPRRSVISLSHSTPSGGTTPTPGWYGSEPIEGQIEDPYSAFKRLRETQPINLTPEGNWRLTRYADVNRVLRSSDAGMRLNSGLLPGQDEQVPGGGLFMLLQDPPYPYAAAKTREQSVYAACDRSMATARRGHHAQAT